MRLTSSSDSSKGSTEDEDIDVGCDSTNEGSLCKRFESVPPSASKMRTHDFEESDGGEEDELAVEHLRRELESAAMQARESGGRLAVKIWP